MTESNDRMAATIASKISAGVLAAREIFMIDDYEEDRRGESLSNRLLSEVIEAVANVVLSDPTNSAVPHVYQNSAGKIVVEL